FVEVGNRAFRIERRRTLREPRPVDTLPVCIAHVEIVEALRVARASLERGEMLEPFQTMTHAPVPASAGESRDRRAKNAPANRRGQQRVHADVTITPVSIVAAEELVAAVAAQHDLDVL